MGALRELVERHRVATPPNVVAARLRANGRLLATPTRGVWEFAPAAHAGPIGHANPTLPLAAALAANPGLRAALTHTGAAWAHGYADRTPARLDVAVPHASHPPAGLACATRVAYFDARLPTERLKGVPVLAPASLLAHLSESPTAVRSWTTVTQWLPELAGGLECETLLRELEGRTTATRVRAGYLLAGLRRDLAELVRHEVGPVVRFGPRDGDVRRHDSTWRVNDTALPSGPTTWARYERGSVPAAAAGASADREPADAARRDARGDDVAPLGRRRGLPAAVGRSRRGRSPDPSRR